MGRELDHSKCASGRRWRSAAVLLILVGALAACQPVIAPIATPAATEPAAAAPTAASATAVAPTAVAPTVAPTAAKAAAASQPLPPEVTLEEAAALRAQGAFVLDVREPAEWDEYHVPDSILIPLGELASRVNEVPRDRDVLVVCRSGNRSKAGRDILIDAGIVRATSLKGGLSQWKAAGYPIASRQ